MAISSSGLNCWILCTPRTGSTFLCELLNNSGAFESYDDPRLKERRGPLERGRAFNEWLRLYEDALDFAQNPPGCLKCIFHQYLEVFGKVDKSKRYAPGYYPEVYSLEFAATVLDEFNIEFLRSHIQDLQFVRLTRRDVVSHSVSLYFARMTQQYHIYSQEQLDEYLKRSVPYNRSIILPIHRDAVALNSVWDKFVWGKDFLDVYYEDLIDDPASVLKSVLSYLKVDRPESAIAEAVDRSTNKRVFRMTRPEAKSYEQLLRFDLGRFH